MIHSRSSVRKVMVVDDDADSAELVGRVLRMHGHEVALANEPMEALALAEAFHPDVALIDIGLPGIDGYELVRRLRALPSMAGCRYVAVTGYRRDSAPTPRSTSDFDEHLVKPVDIAALARSIVAA